LKWLSYTAIAGARNFQFEKTIPNSKEIMRIEFMAPEEFKRAADFRVDVQKGIHSARLYRRHASARRVGRVSAGREVAGRRTVCRESACAPGRTRW
jgi:hypothetical protein